jgi:hypothetical protein
MGQGTTSGDHGDRTDQLLRLALERAYAAFEAHRLGSTMVVRRADVTAADVAALAGPRHQVPVEAVDRWLPHAVTTWGTVADLRALLPRTLELFATGRLDTPPEVVCTKVRLAASHRWTVEEQAALEDVFSAVWLAALARHPSGTGRPAWRLLVALAELGEELSPYLDDWMLMLTTPGPEQDAARRHLVDLVDVVARHATRGATVADLFWVPRPMEARRLATWLSSPVTNKQLSA